MRVGSEEYLDSEEYELKASASSTAPLLPMISRLNRDPPGGAGTASARQHVTWMETANEALIGYAKQSDGNTVFTVVSVDPVNAQEGLAVVPAQLGLPPAFTVRDQLTDELFGWRIGPNYVRRPRRAPSSRARCRGAVGHDRAANDDPSDRA